MPPAFTETVLSATSRAAMLKDIDGDNHPEVIVLGGEAGGLAAYVRDPKAPDGIRTVGYDVAVGTANTLVPVWQHSTSMGAWIGYKPAGGMVDFVAVDGRNSVECRHCGVCR